MRWDPLQQTFLVYPGGGGDSAPSSTTNTTQLYSPDEAAKRAKIMAEAERIYSQTSGAGANLPGPRAGGNTQLAQQLMRQQALGGMSDVASQIPGAMQFGMSDVLDPTSSPGFQASLDTALRGVDQRFMSPTGPFAGIRTASQTQNTGGSGTREGIAMGMAGRDYLNTIGDVTGRMTSDAYGKGLDVFSRTLATAPSAMATMGMPAQAIGAVGSQEDSLDMAQQQWQLQAPWAAFGPYASTLSGMTGPSGTTSTATGSAPQGGMGAAGMALMGASAGAAFGPWGAAIGAGAGLLLSMMD